MKRIIQGSILMFIGVLFVLIILANVGRGSRQTETGTALAEAIDTTLSSMFENHTYATAADTDKFVADFLEALLLQMESDSDIQVSILKADPEKGILSVEVTQTYTHPNGNTGTVSEVRTVIFDKEQEESPPQYVVEFYTADDELYKRYTLPEGSVCTMPVSPEKEGKTFSCWRFVTGGSGSVEGTTVSYADGSGSKTVLATEGLPYTVNEDTRFIAVFE